MMLRDRVRDDLIVRTRVNKSYLKVQNYIDTDTFPDTFRNSAKFQVDYSSSTQGDIPIITLVDDVSSWEVGDQIMVASTSFEVRESETFTIVECPECTANQVKLDRPATFTHWGRIDTDSGIIDQRAEVGLLSRNVRFYGEMSSTTCQYALTRESLDSNSPNNGVSWCRIGPKFFLRSSLIESVYDDFEPEKLFRGYGRCRS